MILISKETLLTHLQRAEMASDVRLPIEFFRDLVYQAMPHTWVGLTDEERTEIRREHYARTLPLMDAVEAKLKEKNFD
jgi:hypothetical protein